MVRKTKEDALATRASILSSATRLFVSKGFSGTSLEDIARASEVTRGAIYWHFKNKADIFDAIHENLYKPVTELLLDNLERDHPDPLLQLRDILVRLLQSLETDEEVRTVLTLFLTRCDYSGDLECYLEEHKKRRLDHMDLFARYFEKAVEKGCLSDNEDPEALALAVACYLKGMTVEYLKFPDSFRLSEQAPYMVDIFFRGVEREDDLIIAGW